jgi:hypothetical protein
MGTHLAVAAIQFLVAQMSNTVPLFEEHTRKLDEVVATYPDNAGVKQVVTVLKAQMALEFWKDYQTWEAGKDNLERDRVDVAARYPENLAEFDELYWQWQHYITSAKDLMGQPAAAYEDCEKIQRSPGQTTLSFGNLGGAGERFAQLDREFADKRRQNIVEMQASLAQLIMSNPEMASAVYGRQQTSSNS